MCCELQRDLKHFDYKSAKKYLEFNKEIKTAHTSPYLEDHSQEKHCID